MKKTAATSALLVLIVSLASPGWAARAAIQKSASKETVDVPFPSKVGDRVRYALTYAPTGGNGQPSATTDVTIEITGTDGPAFLITWAFGAWHGGSASDEADIEGHKVIDLMRSVRLLLRVDPTLASPPELLNWEELQTRLAEGRQELQKTMTAKGMSRQDFERLDSWLGTFYQNRGAMTGYYTKEASMFFSLLGKRIPATRPVETAIELPNPFGGDPLPGRARISVKDYDPVRRKAVVLNTATLDSARAQKIFDQLARDFVARFAPEVTASMPKGALFKSIAIDGETELGLDLVSGWPDSLTYKTAVAVVMASPDAPPGSDMAYGEFLTMTRIGDDVPPATPGQGSDWRALLKKAEDLRLAGDSERALEELDRAVALALRSTEAGHPDVAVALDTLALLYDERDQAEDAEALFKRSLAIREKAFGPAHPEVALALDHLAMSYDGQHRYDEAEPLLKRAQAIREKAFGPDSPEAATSISLLATLQLHRGYLAEAEVLYKRALAIREKALGPDHPDVAQSLLDLALLGADIPGYGDAESLFKRSLAILEKTLGPDHIRSAAVLKGLADFYDNHAEIVKAAPFFARWLAIMEKAKGPEDPDLVPVLARLAEARLKQRRYADAEALDKRALAITEKAEGPEDREVADRLSDLAFVYFSQNKYGEAEPLYVRCIAIREKALGRYEADILAGSLSDLASLYEILGRYAEAEPLYKRSLALFEKALGPDHRDVATSLENLARLYRATKRVKEAEECEARAARIRAIKR